MTPNNHITLTTDFGTTDGYVASMKGVIYTLNPQCTITDVSHNASPQDITGAGFVLSSAYRFFPQGTVHCAVVDPGVGTDRRPIVAESCGFFFIGPDNGLFSFVLSGNGESRVHVISNPDYMLPSPSDTFHGRDIFAPAAAHLALGRELSDFGPRITDYCVLPVADPIITPGGTLRGTVIHTDSFGNLITNITRTCFEHFVGSGSFSLTVGGSQCRHRVATYAQAEGDDLVCLIGSSGHLELSVKNGSARDTTGADTGHDVWVNRDA